jgi:TatD DNase family protein
MLKASIPPDGSPRDSLREDPRYASSPDGDEVSPAYPDSHAHLSYVAERLGPSFLPALARRYADGEALIVDPGVDAGDYGARKAMLGGYGFVRLAAGIWPDPSALPDMDAALAGLEADARDGSCAAIGECGLDYHWMKSPPELQERLFRGQAELALRYAKPLIVHSRAAFPDTLRICADYAGKVAVIIHCFGYDADAASDFLSRGCYLSFAGNISYKKADDLRSALRSVPLDRLLIETDAPYMNPMPRRGKDSSPFDIERTYALAAEVKKIGQDELADAVRKTMAALFKAY